MLKKLGKDTGIKCNAHSFRRGFAGNLHRKGYRLWTLCTLVDGVLWGMVLNYTRSITFEDCLEHHRKVQLPSQV